MLQKFSGWTIFLLIISNSGLGQTIVTGTVRDARGLPVVAASILPKDARKGTTTDTLGIFRIKTNPGGLLTISAVGFADTTISINYQRNITVILRQKTKALNQVVISATEQNQSVPLSHEILSEQIVQNTLQDFAKDIGMTDVPIGGAMPKPPTINGGGFLPVYHQPVETKGSRYLLSAWSNGLVVNLNDSIVYNPTYLFNFDKITGDLLLTLDMKSDIEIDRPSVKSFALKDEKSTYIFVHVPLIDQGDGYFQVLARGDKFAVYKSIKTKMVRASQMATGLTVIGNDYNEYVDEIIYYFVDLKMKTVKQFELRKKSIRDAAASEKNKTEKYFADHKMDDIGDDFLKGFVAYLNS